MFYVLADKGKHNCYLPFSSAKLPFHLLSFSLKDTLLQLGRFLIGKGQGINVMMKKCLKKNNVFMLCNEMPHQEKLNIEVPLLLRQKERKFYFNESSFGCSPFLS